MFSSYPNTAFRPRTVMMAVALLATMSAATFPAQAGSCESTSRDDALVLVRDSTNKLLAAAKAYDGVLSDNPARASELVDEFITPHVDLKGFSRLVLGKYWRRATPEQRTRFLTHFHALVLHSYATALTANTTIPIKYLPVRAESRTNRNLNGVIFGLMGFGVLGEREIRCGARGDARAGE